MPRIDESDMRALPDPTTFALLPWRPRQNAVARMFCDIQTPSGEPFAGDPRQVLKRNLEHLARLGYTYYVGPELEFFYFKDNQTTEPLDTYGYYDQLSSHPASDLRRNTVLNLSDLGIPVKYSHHEGAPGQHEIDLQYTDALTMADSVMTAKLVIKELAQLSGAYGLLHAQTHHRCQRLRHARAPVPIPGGIATPSTTWKTSSTCRSPASDS